VEVSDQLRGTTAVGMKRNSRLATDCDAGWAGYFGEEKIFLSLLRIESQFLRHPTRILYHYTA